MSLAQIAALLASATGLVVGSVALKQSSTLALELKGSIPLILPSKVVVRGKPSCKRQKKREPADKSRKTKKSRSEPLM